MYGRTTLIFITAKQRFFLVLLMTLNLESGWAYGNGFVLSCGVTWWQILLQMKSGNLHPSLLACFDKQVRWTRSSRLVVHWSPKISLRNKPDAGKLSILPSGSAPSLKIMLWWQMEKILKNSTMDLGKEKMLGVYVVRCTSVNNVSAFGIY